MNAGGVEPTRWERRLCGLGHRLGIVLDWLYDAAGRGISRLTGDAYQSLEEQARAHYQWGYDMARRQGKA